MRSIGNAENGVTEHHVSSGKARSDFQAAWVVVKRLTIKKTTVLGDFMEDQGEGENTSSVLYWDGKKYRYQKAGSRFERQIWPDAGS